MFGSTQKGVEINGGTSSLSVPLCHIRDSELGKWDQICTLCTTNERFLDNMQDPSEHRGERGRKTMSGARNLDPGVLNAGPSGVLNNGIVYDQSLTVLVMTQLIPYIQSLHSKLQFMSEAANVLEREGNEDYNRRGDRWE